MKSFSYPWLALLTLLACFSACEKEITNPFDPDCPKEIWTPADFQAEQAENAITLTWELENRNISGFKIDRKVGSQDWSNVASPGKTATSWTDADPVGGEIHQYRLYAQAGDNQSNTVTTQITPVLTANISTLTQTNLTCRSATLGGVITTTGGATITERGIVYALKANPTITDTKIVMGSGEGTFSQTVTGLAEATTYYVKAFATNSAGTSYGNPISFSTPNCPTLNFYFSAIKVTSTVLPGGTININCTITGTGLILRTYSPTVAIYISSNGLITSKDKPVYEVQATLSSLKPSFSFSHQVTAPSFSTSFYLVFLADSKREYDESDESDNRETTKITVGK